MIVEAVRMNEMNRKKSLKKKNERKIRKKMQVLKIRGCFCNIDFTPQEDQVYPLCTLKNFDFRAFSQRTLSPLNQRASYQKSLCG